MKTRPSTKTGRTTPWDVLRHVEHPHLGRGQCTYYVIRPHGSADCSGTVAYSARHRRAPVNSDRDRRTDPRRPRPWCIRALRTFTHAPHRNGWHARRREELCPLGTVSEAYWLVRAPVPISGIRGSHGGLGGRSVDRNPESTLFAGSGCSR